jgi:hypothetical protein
MSAEELAAWLDSEISRMEDMRVRFSQLKRPMGLSKGQEIELAVLRSVRSKI